MGVFEQSETLNNGIVLLRLERARKFGEQLTRLEVEQTEAMPQEKDTETEISPASPDLAA